jgi:ADP-ribose pyrophosphatase YjhB (NUDIX family)
MARTPPSHAGGVVFRTTEEGHVILLVRAKPAPHDWVLPKGHIETGETPEECARREIREEAGVDSEAVLLLGHDEFTTPQQKHVAVAFYLMRYCGEVPPSEERERCWIGFAKALALLPFSGAQRIIRAAQAELDSAPDRHRRR